MPRQRPVDDAHDNTSEKTLEKLHLEGAWAEWARAAETDAQVAALAKAMGLDLPEGTLKEAVRDYRARNGLKSRDALKSWLGETRISRRRLSEHCRVQWQREVLRAILPRNQVEDWFRNHRADYDAALVSVVSADNEEEAWIVRAAADEAPERFDELAWERKQADPSLPPGGALGWRLRRDLPKKTARAIFDNDTDSVAGPVLLGGIFCVYRVWRRRPADWSLAIEALCREDCLAARLDGVSRQ